MSKKGVTIVELLITIIIIGIIASFSVLAVSEYLTSSKLKADQQTVVTLNDATTGYHLFTNLSTIFSEEATSEDNITTLVNEGFLSSTPIPQSDNASFVWDNDLSIWYVTIDGEATSLSPYGTTPQEITPNLVSDIQDFYTNNGRYGRSWGDYRYTDLGLEPEDWENPISHIYYTPSGKNLYLTPEDGYQFVLTNDDGDEFILKASYNWNLIYNDESGNWYYHTISDENLVNFSSLVVEAY